MRFQVNKSSAFPLYLQLKEQVKYFLLSGELEPGTRLPSPKELAAYLQINRNTVIAAYKELENEGILVSKQGQGTYLTGGAAAVPDNAQKQSLIKLVQETIQKAEELGYSTDELFTALFHQSVLAEGSGKKNPRILLVECNQPDLDYYCGELEKELGVTVNGCVLDRLGDALDEDLVQSADFVVTTFNHAEDVRAIMEPLGKKVIAIAWMPPLATMMGLGQLPAGTRVLLVCAREDGAANMKKAVEAAGITHIKMQSAGLNQIKNLRGGLDNAEMIVASRVAIGQVRAMLGSDSRLMEYASVLDRAGIEFVRKYIEDERF